VLNDTDNNSSHPMNKIFDAHYKVLLFLCTVICVFPVIVTPYTCNTFHTVGLLHPHAYNKSTIDTKTATIL